jgi:hypothetical protein
MGNSLAHLREKVELEESLRSLAARLKRDGVLFV